MSIIGIVWFSLSLFCILNFAGPDDEAAIGWGVLGLLYAIPFSITALVKTLNKTKKPTNVYEQLIKLQELRDKNIFTEDEFVKKKEVLLAKMD
jgi:hypothetical protein